LAKPTANLVPERGKGTPAELLARFIVESESAAATVARVAGRAGIPAAVAGYLTAHGLPRRVRAAPALKDVPWPEGIGIAVDYGKADADTPIGLSCAVSGIAETGTLVLPSGPATPTTLNYLPDVHIVALETARIVGSYEDAWARFREEAGGGNFMPRTVNWITGPSRSADIELILLLGVHGPRRLHILLLDGQDA
jgi:L-lactate dehydrogenase complex protein LldG